VSQRSLARPDPGIASAGYDDVADVAGTRPCLGTARAMASALALLRFVLNGTRASDGRFAVAKQKSPADGAYRRIVSHNKRVRSVTPERRVGMLR